MKVLIADKFEASGIAALKADGFEVIEAPGTTGAALREEIAKSRCQVLVVRGTQVTAEMLEAGSELALVVRAGAGVNTIDVEAASRRSILVANCPGKNAVAVAELTIGLILALDRRIVENVNDLRRGVWNKKEYSRAHGLKGRTLGILGMGTIGEAVAHRAMALEMKVAAWSRSLTADRAEALGITRCASPIDVAKISDVLTVHLAAAKETRNLVDRNVLAALRPEGYFINTSRADVVDYEALAQMVRERNIRVGLDVFAKEPTSGEGAFADAIVQAGGVVYGTHHIGASTDQAQEAIAEETVRIIRMYRKTGRVENCVNVHGSPHARFVLIVRHLNRPGVLAHTLNAISHAGVNVEEMENVICAGEVGACAQIKLAGPLPEAVLSQIRAGNPNILGLVVRDI